MELPDASIHSGFAAMVSRSADAIRSGCVVAIGEVPVFIHAPEPGRALAMAELLAGLETSGAEPRCSLVFDVGDATVPMRAADDVLPDGEVWQGGATFAMRHASGLVAVADAIDARISGDAAALRWPFRRLFHPTITHLLAHQLRYVVHGAAVADDEGAVLVLGGSGQGKSTAAIAALAAGDEVLGDDLVVIVPRANGGYDVIGVPRPMAVPGDVLDDVGGMAPILGDPRHRVELAPDHLSAHARPLVAIVVSDHVEDGRATLERERPSVVLGEVLSSFTATRNSELLQGFFPHALTLSQVPAWRLRHSSDPGARLDEAAALLADVRAFARSARS